MLFGVVILRILLNQRQASLPGNNEKQDKVNKFASKQPCIDEHQHVVHKPNSARSSRQECRELITPSRSPVEYDLEELSCQVHGGDNTAPGVYGPGVTVVVCVLWVG